MSREISQLYEFDAFRLDPAERQLLHGGTPVPLTPKVFDTLVVLVERSGHLVEKEELLNLVWADAFVEEANLARCIHTLRKALGEEHDKQQYIETVPKRGYRFVAEVRALTNGDARVTTPAKTEVESQEQAEAATENSNGAGAAYPIPEVRRNGTGAIASSPSYPAVAPAPLPAAPRWRVIAAVFIIPLIVAVAVGAYWYVTRSRQTATDKTPINSLAVLPFVNVGANPETEYLSDGISESLINSLSQLPSLKKVIARSSSFKYKGKDADPQEVSRLLGVAAIVTGRVLQREGQLQISVELMDARTGTQVWGEQYNRPTADLLAVQAALSGEIARQLRLKLTKADQQQLAKRETVNSEAYELILRGRAQREKGSPENLKSAVEFYKQASTLDPRTPACRIIHHLRFACGLQSSEPARISAASGGGSAPGSGVRRESRRCALRTGKC